MPRVLGAHDVTLTRLFSVARVRGVTASILPVVLGLWILYHQDTLFRTPAWQELREIVEGRIDVIAWLILIGGLLGVAGLAFGSRLLSLFSCMVGIIWFAWMDAFLWYANFTDSPNIGAFFCLYALLEYVYRMALLADLPEPGEEYGQGW